MAPAAFTQRGLSHPPRSPEVSAGVSSDVPGASVALSSRVEFSAEDFARRWQRARLAALSLGSASPHSFSESELIAKVLPEDRDQVLRAVFDNSRKLALSHARHLGLVWELGDFRDVLSSIGIPCMGGQWETRERSVVLSRKGCSGAGNEPQAFYCDYWREAIDGLVMGASEDERFVRHASRGHGDEVCTDVFFKDGAIPNKQTLRYAPIPETMAEELKIVQAKLLGLKAAVEFKGLSEGTLYYSLETTSGDQACGTGGKIIHEHLRQSILAKWPHLAIQDTSPLAVYGEKA